MTTDKTTKMLADACEAQEHYTLDELEAHAAEQRAKARADKLFAREPLPAHVTWNEFYDLCDRAARLSRLLNRANRTRKAAGRSTFLRTTIAHNVRVSALLNTIDQPAFEAWAESNLCCRSDLPWVAFASHPKYL